MTVRFSPSFLQALLEQFSAPPDPQSSISGILWGKAADAVQVTELRPGRAALLPPPAADSGQAAPLVPVGWLARRTAGGLLDSDIRFHQQHFPKPHDLAIISRVAEGLLCLEVYARSQDGLLDEQAHRWAILRLNPATTAVPPAEVILRDQSRDDLYGRTFEVNPGAEQDPYPAPAGSSILGTVASAIPRELPRQLFILLAAAFTIITAVTFYLALSYFMARNEAYVPPRSSPFGLHIHGQGDHVLVLWDGARAAGQHAGPGLLNIDDGNLHREMTLDFDQLHAGSIFYVPQSSDVTFRLRVPSSRGEVLTDSVRILDTHR